MKHSTYRAGSVSARSAPRKTLLLAFTLATISFLPARAEELTLEKIPFNGARAYDYLKQLCDIGPRVTASSGMKQQQELLTKHFEQLGAKVTLQKFRAKQGGAGR